MLFFHPLLWIVFSLITFAKANKGDFDESFSQVCTGMYSKKEWSGRVNPYIQIHLNKFTPMNEGDDTSVSFVVFEYRDFELIGTSLPDGTFKYICDEAAIENNICDSDSLNKFIVSAESNDTATSLILTDEITELGSADIDYPVKETGYYCVATYSVDAKKYSGYVNFRNSFGQLSAAEIPKLPAYGILAICYAVGLFIYLFNYYRHKNEILPLQKYIAYFFGFLTAETILIWSYYDLENSKGTNAGVKVYMFFISILNAGRITFSFFLLLVISLGYGVVHAKLNNKLMLKCKIFALVTFLCAVVYIVGNYLSDPEYANYTQLITLIPIALALSVFYVVILASIRKTTEYLTQQRQIIKLKLYRYLFRIIFVSLLVVFLGVVVSAFIFIGMSTTELIEQHWKSRFFVFDFWPSLVYFCVFCAIAFIWRPTETSYMLAVSQQVATNPENARDFDLDDLSLISRDEENGYARVDDDDVHNKVRDSSDSIDFELHDNENEGNNPFADENQIHQPSSSSKHDDPPAYDSETRRSLDDDNTVFQLDDELDTNDDDRLKKND